MYDVCHDPLISFDDVVDVLSQSIASGWVGTADTDSNAVGTTPDLPKDSVAAVADAIFTTTKAAAFNQHVTDNGLDR